MESAADVALAARVVPTDPGIALRDRDRDPGLSALSDRYRRLNFFDAPLIMPQQ